MMTAWDGSTERRIQKEDKNEVSIETFADIIGKSIEVNRSIYTRQWHAKFEHGEIAEDGFLKGVFGKGSTPTEALWDYIHAIEGRKIVFTMGQENRQEYNVPDNLTL